MLIGVLCNNKNLLKLVLCPHGLGLAGHVALENNINETCAVPAIAVGWVSLAAKTKVSTSGCPKDELIYQLLPSHLKGKGSIQKGKGKYRISHLSRLKLKMLHSKLYLSKSTVQ